MEDNQREATQFDVTCASCCDDGECAKLVATNPAEPAGNANSTLWQFLVEKVHMFVGKAM